MKTTAKALTLALCFLFADLAHAQSEMQPVGKDVYHFFSGRFSSLVAIGDSGVMVTDPGWTARAKELKEAVGKLTDKPISHVVLSHEHYDHAGGTEVFENADIVCHASCEKIFKLDVSGQMPQSVTKSFDDELAIDIGGKRVELKHFGAGDGVATTVIYVPDDQVVATADLYGPKSLTSPMWLDDKNYLGTRKILNAVAGWQLKHAISGHSASTDPQALRENAEFLNDLYVAVKAELDKAIAADGRRAWIKALRGPLSETLKLPKYKEWKGYDKNLPKHVFRMGMSIMHGG